MTGPRRLVSTDPAMRAATLAACAMGKYDIEDSCTLDAKNEDLKLPHLRWRYQILSSDMCLTYVFLQCSCMGIWFVIQMLEFQEILAMNRFYHLRGNDSWCFAMREVYKWSRIHKPSPPTVCKHFTICHHTISRSLGFSYPWTAGCSPCFESFEWQRCLGKCQYLAWLLGLWTSGSGSNEAFGGTALLTGGVDVDMEPSELKNPEKSLIQWCVYIYIVRNILYIYV